jgi:hypothetical protein
MPGTITAPVGGAGVFVVLALALSWAPWIVLLVTTDDVQITCLDLVGCVPG